MEQQFWRIDGCTSAGMWDVVEARGRDDIEEGRDERAVQAHRLHGVGQVDGGLGPHRFAVNEKGPKWKKARIRVRLFFGKAVDCLQASLVSLVVRWLISRAGATATHGQGMILDWSRHS